MKYDVIIIGAGAAGLMAAHDLSAAGYQVCLLEAAAVAGGRIAMLQDPSFPMPVETGAEFVHGALPLTLDLLQAAGIDYIPVEGKMIAVQNGQWHKQQAHDRHWPAFARQLDKLKTDMSIAQFLQENFGGEQYAELREAVKHYSEGFDLADIRDASAMAAKREWLEEEETQFRIPGGYSQLTDYLLQTCKQNGAAIHFSKCATAIQYNKENVTVQCKDQQSFNASKVIVTVSAGLLQSGVIQFDPEPDLRFMQAFQQVGFGDVIKILLQFKESFWTAKSDDIGFILSDEVIPTWWTQLPVKNNLLTGWLGGPEASLRSRESVESLLDQSLKSLSNIFDVPIAFLQQQLMHHRVICWSKHPTVKGGYSYLKPASFDAKKILSHPVSGVMFFAGEAFYQGDSQGTVEAALQSGREVAHKLKEFA